MSCVRLHRKGLDFKASFVEYYANVSYFVLISVLISHINVLNFINPTRITLNHFGVYSFEDVPKSFSKNPFSDAP